MTPALDPTRTGFTDQEVFDATVRHAAKMPSRSASFGNHCMYRVKGKDETENACFVGGLLTDEEAYKADRVVEFSSDGSGVYSIMSSGLLPARLVPNIKLLSDLQTVHDDPAAERSDWPELLKRVADNHELDPAVIDEAFAPAKAA